MPGKPPKTANQLRLFAKAKERKAVAAYMAPASQYDEMNKDYARRILASHAAGKDVKPFYLAYARNVAERLNLDAN